MRVLVHLQQLLWHVAPLLSSWSNVHTRKLATVSGGQVWYGNARPADDL